MDFKTHNGRPPDGLAPRQRAVPAIDSLTPGFYRSGSGGLSYLQHVALRQRKTPYGHVYERDPGISDAQVQLPASKHVLLSVSPPTSAQRPLRYNSSSGHSPYQLDPYQTNAMHHTNTVGTPFTLGQPPSWDFPSAPLDSMLNQSQTQRYYLQPGSRVPIVLPQMQNHYGPTASAGQEYFGPYFPDGQYVPYRPASIRDDRFYTSRLPFPPNVNSQLPPVAPSVLRRPGKFPPGFQHIDSAPIPSAQYGAGFVGYNSFVEPTPLDVYPQYHNHPQDGGYQSSPWPSELTIDRSMYQNVEAESMAFREKSFSWAHRAYGDLLALHQRNARETHLAGPASVSKSGPSKMSMFPKPPKPKGSSMATASGSPMPCANQPHRNSCDSMLDQTQTRPKTAIFSPHRRSSDSAQPVPQSLNMKTLPVGHFSFKGDFRPPLISSISQHDTIEHGMAVRQTAGSALQTMEALCDQAKTPWVDGMLLAGCLAYGLACYEKALKWNQAILQQDPTHVEAMSNLAATLFALNRLDEALKNWTSAVQLRPSYFEAVEHLVGLFCSTRRAKEAVDLIEFVEAKLKILPADDIGLPSAYGDSDVVSNDSTFSNGTVLSADSAQYNHDSTRRESVSSDTSGFGSSGYGIPGSENGRMLALIHAKGNMLYALGKNSDAADAFESAVLIATGNRKAGVRGLIHQILYACLKSLVDPHELKVKMNSRDPVLLGPTQAEATARNLFPPTGQLPGLAWILQQRQNMAAKSTTSNSLLSLAKIYQDAMSTATEVGSLRTTSTRDILALYYLSLSLQKSPSTANNVGILLAGVQHSAFVQKVPEHANPSANIPGVIPGSGISLALLYYNYGLNLDNKHAHLYTNLGSLLKDIGQLSASIKMYENAVACDPTFDIALANLANAVKDQGRVAEAIGYYRRAVDANPNFAEAVCGLATALNSVCNWHGRGGVCADNGGRDRVHVDDSGQPADPTRSYGWMNRVIETVEKQLKEGETWGVGTLSPAVVQSLCQQLTAHVGPKDDQAKLTSAINTSLQSWAGKAWEGSRIVRLVERAIRHISWQWYQDRYKSKNKKEYPVERYTRPHLPGSLSVPPAPTVLPFHTFTTPLSAKAIRQISQRNAQRISVSTLRSAWLPGTVFPPPRPPQPHLNVGYVSSDFGNHPLAHLMQSTFGFHDQDSVRAVCYATSASDGSNFRAQIEREAPLFRDVSSWSVERLVKQIVDDNIHILINLNGYTRGARNEVFAARPAPIHMSFMGFAGTLGAEWCDYVLADEISVPFDTLSPWRRNVDIEDKLHPDELVEDDEDWIYNENIVFARETFFCVDHKQSAPDAETRPSPTATQSERDSLWRAELQRRWKLRKEIFPQLSDDAIILGNFNQLYKIDPATFRMYLRILAHVPNAVLWLLRFPDLGEQHLRRYAQHWAGAAIAERIVFTDVAIKSMHLTRSSVVDLFLDTPECNGHTTAADVVWSGTPILTWGRWSYKMCSRMAGSILTSALPDTEEGRKAQRELTVNVPLPRSGDGVQKELSGEKGERQYINKAVALARGLRYPDSVKNGESKDRGTAGTGEASGRLMEMRRMLWEGRWDSRLFDTKRWVRDLETAYWVAWRKWEKGEGGDIYL